MTDEERQKIRERLAANGLEPLKIGAFAEPDMTNKERQKLVIDLLVMAADEEEYIANRCAKAADEIERLADRVRLLETELSAFMGENHD